MKSKKSKNANLEQKRGLFFSLGLVICSSLVLMAFTYSTAEDNTVLNQKIDKGLQDEIVYELPEPEIPEEVPEQKNPPVILDQVNIVEDDIDIDPVDFIDPDDMDYIPEDEEDYKIEKEEIVDFAEVEPAFPGGEAAMMEFIQTNIVYPQQAVEIGDQGIVYIKFVVNKDGSIEQVNIARGISDSLDEEALEVVKKMPNWTPGEQAGKKVRCRFTLPINFVLN